jgi:hypothetical protein
MSGVYFAFLFCILLDWNGISCSWLLKGNGFKCNIPGGKSGIIIDFILL